MAMCECGRARVPGSQRLCLSCTPCLSRARHLPLVPFTTPSSEPEPQPEPKPEPEVSDIRFLPPRAALRLMWGRECGQPFPPVLLH